MVRRAFHPFPNHPHPLRFTSHAHASAIAPAPRLPLPASARPLAGGHRPESGLARQRQQRPERQGRRPGAFAPGRAAGADQPGGAGQLGAQGGRGQLGRPRQQRALPRAARGPGAGRRAAQRPARFRGLDAGASTLPGRLFSVDGARPLPGRGVGGRPACALGHGAGGAASRVPADGRGLAGLLPPFTPSGRRRSPPPHLRDRPGGRCLGRLARCRRRHRQIPVPPRLRQLLQPATSPHGRLGAGLQRP